MVFDKPDRQTFDITFFNRMRRLCKRILLLSIKQVQGTDNNSGQQIGKEKKKKKPTTEPPPTNEKEPIWQN